MFLCYKNCQLMTVVRSVSPEAGLEEAQAGAGRGIVGVR